MARPTKNVDLAAELGEDIDLTEEQANAYRAPKPEAVAPVAPAQMHVSVTDIQAIVKAAVEAAQGGNKEIAELVTQGIAQARQPIPERTDADNPRISTMNPLGDKAHPRPGLKCDFFLGIREGKSGAVQRSYEWIADDLSACEQVALNTLEPMAKTIHLTDGTEIKVELVATRNDITDEITRMVLVLPQFVMQKGSQHRNAVPSICHIVEQLTGKNFAKLSNDDLAWLMAEHRAKRYVSARESVAA